MPGPNIAGQRHPDDDGSADPGAVAALAAFAAGEGSEHAALAALATARLLVPVVATMGEESSEMALPTLIGNDGRPALPAFTCLDALRRWRPDARPVPVPAPGVWQAAQETGAVVIDVAGPVPLAVDGARLAALAEGRPVPLPHEDPDVTALAREALGRQDVITGFRLLPAAGDADLALEVAVEPSCDAARAREAVSRSVAGIMSGAGGRTRRGVEVSITVAGRAK